MQTNANPVLTSKQQRLLLGLAEGLSQRDAARNADLHPSSACIIAKRPDFREALLRLRGEAEARLVSRLPDLVDQALNSLEIELNYPSERRIRAVKITLDLAARMLVTGPQTPADDPHTLSHTLAADLDALDSPP